MEEVGFEKFMELGERHTAAGDPDRAIHYYNSALKISPAAPAAQRGLARALSLKADKGEPVFRVLALDALRKAAAAEPESEETQALLIGAAVKAGRLGELAAEYRARLKADPENAALKKRLKAVYVVSLLENDVTVPSVGYRPVFFIKVFFDCVLLPLGASIIVAANVMPKARPSLIIGVFIFFCYAVYRSLVWFFSRR